MGEDERQARARLMLIDGLLPMSQREREIGIALTEAKHLLRQTLEYILPWSGPSAAAMRARIEAHIPVIQKALATEFGVPATYVPSDSIADELAALTPESNPHG